MSIAIAIAGAAGRMGRALIAAAVRDDRFHIAGATERAGSAAIGLDIGVVAGASSQGVVVSDNARAAAANADVWLDFTTPDATLAAIDALTGTKVRAAIVGTTGLTADQEKSLAGVAGKLALVRSGNFSLGVNLLAALTEEAARRLADWDVEIVETHHRRKVDAPSGTALMLGEAAAKGRNAKLDTLALKPRDGITGARPEGKIGFASLRAGGVVGDHEVIFGAEREVVRLQHQALDRAVFADGALAAARWAAGKPAGAYSMRDVLGL